MSIRRSHDHHSRCLRFPNRIFDHRTYQSYPPPFIHPDIYDSFPISVPNPKLPRPLGSLNPVSRPTQTTTPSVRSAMSTGLRRAFNSPVLRARAVVRSILVPTNRPFLVCPRGAMLELQDLEDGSHAKPIRSMYECCVVQIDGKERGRGQPRRRGERGEQMGWLDDIQRVF